MQDFDKWPALIQWLLGAGAFIGATLAAWFGSRAARRNRSSEADAEIELEQARAAIRDNEIRRELEQIVAASRRSFYDENRQLAAMFQNEIAELEKRLRVVEQESYALKNRTRRSE